MRLAHENLTESPIRDFVPVLVEHTARDRLAFAERPRLLQERRHWHLDRLSCAVERAPREQDEGP